MTLLSRLAAASRYGTSNGKVVPVWEGQGMKKHEVQKVAKGKARGWRVKEGSRKPGAAGFRTETSTQAGNREVLAYRRNMTCLLSLEWRLWGLSDDVCLGIDCLSIGQTLEP